MKPCGQIDFQAIYMQFSDYAVLKENEEQGDYTIIDWLIALPPCVNVNQSVQDPGLTSSSATTVPAWLSHGINRGANDQLGTAWLSPRTPPEQAGRLLQAGRRLAPPRSSTTP